MKVNIIKLFLYGAILLIFNNACKQATTGSNLTRTQVVAETAEALGLSHDSFGECSECIVNPNEYMLGIYLTNITAIQSDGCDASNLGNVFFDAGADILTAASKCSDEALGIAEDGYNTVKEGTIDAYNTVKDTTVDAYNTTVDTTVDAYNTTVDTTSDAYNTTVDTTNNAISTVNDTVDETQKTTKKIKKAFGFGLTDSPLDTGVSAVTGVTGSACGDVKLTGDFTITAINVSINPDTAEEETVEISVDLPVTSLETKESLAINELFVVKQGSIIKKFQNDDVVKISFTVINDNSDQENKDLLAQAGSLRYGADVNSMTDADILEHEPIYINRNNLPDYYYQTDDTGIEADAEEKDNCSVYVNAYFAEVIEDPNKNNVLRMYDEKNENWISP
ncbi:MAG: hypothetical protein CMP11_03030 [Zetaproteobacteria bacterium]|nr:hypothetical protein [Pseudobdellovibrionaceae bacterium]